ncbi:hypothetical protein [Haloferax sp. Q22]|uniref:hypothetical protein n=1 Tax=Haloferax sp. (strain Q22) TaxID=1526048 RepID=UPI000737CF80|nr:hypothetical protein [Haloferax sp. Q22]
MALKYTLNDRSINTRSYAEEVVKEAIKKGCTTLDLSKVEIISRSAADELHHYERTNEVEIVGLNGEPAQMYDIVKRDDPVPA